MQKAVGKSIDPRTQPIAELTRAVPLKDTFGGQADTRLDKALLAGMNASVFTANAAARYALPAGGVTLAGKGLYDLTMTLAYGGPADQQEKGQLSLR